MHTSSGDQVNNIMNYLQAFQSIYRLSTTPLQTTHLSWWMNKRKKNTRFKFISTFSVYKSYFSKVSLDLNASTKMYHNTKTMRIQINIFQQFNLPNPLYCFAMQSHLHGECVCMRVALNLIDIQVIFSDWKPQLTTRNIMLLRKNKTQTRENTENGRKSVCVMWIE